MTVKINSDIHLFSKLCNSRLSGVLNNFYDSTGMLKVDEGVGLVDNRLKILQKQYVLQIQNVRFIPAFLLSNTRTAFLFQNASPTFINNARSASDARPTFYQLQNARLMFYLFQNTMPVFLTLNAMAAFQHNARSAFQQNNTRPTFSIACLQDIKCLKALTLRGSRLAPQMLSQWI